MNKVFLTGLLTIATMTSAYANCSQYSNANQLAICQSLENSSNQAQQNFQNSFINNVNSTFQNLVPSVQQSISQPSYPNQYQPRTAPAVQQPQIQPLQPQQQIIQPRVRYY